MLLNFYAAKSAVGIHLFHFSVSVLLPIKKIKGLRVFVFFQLEHLVPYSIANMEILINLLILVVLVAILITLRDILHYSRLTVFKIATKDTVPATPKGPKARRVLKF